jgi:hypothetical protein
MTLLLEPALVSCEPAGTKEECPSLVCHVAIEERAQLPNSEDTAETLPLKRERSSASELRSDASEQTTEDELPPKILSGPMEVPWIRNGATQKLQTLQWQTTARSYLSVVFWLATAYLVVLASVATGLVGTVAVDVYTPCIVRVRHEDPLLTDVYTSCMRWDVQQKQYIGIPVPTYRLLIGKLVIVALWISVALQSAQAFLLLDARLCRNYMASSLSKGCNELRSIDLTICLPLSMALMTVSVVQADENRLWCQFVVVIAVCVLWTLGDSWHWMVWATLRVHRGTPTVFFKETRTLLSVVGWFLLVFAWMTNSIEFTYMTATTVFVDGQRVRLLPDVRVFVVMAIHVSHITLGVVQLLRHWFEPTANRALVGECVFVLANLLLKTSMMVGVVGMLQSPPALGMV